MADATSTSTTVKRTWTTMKSTGRRTTPLSPYRRRRIKLAAPLPLHARDPRAPVTIDCCSLLLPLALRFTLHVLSSFRNTGRALQVVGRHSTTANYAKFYRVCLYYFRFFFCLTGLFFQRSLQVRPGPRNLFRITFRDCY